MMVLRKNIPCDELREKYLDEGKSEAEIAKEYGCGKSTIARRRADCDIPGRRGPSATQIKRRAFINRETLERLYVAEGKSEKDIGAIKNRDPRTVRRLLLDHNIPMRKRQAPRDRITQETLRRMYVVDHRSMASIAREFECSRKAVSGLLNEYGIEKRRKRFDGILTKEFLTEAYVDDEMSAKEIAEKVGCGTYTVYKYIHRHGIRTREDRSAEYKSFLARCRVEGQRRRSEIVEMLGGRCSICRRDKVTLHIHHMCYMPDDVIYDNYPNNPMKYYIDLHGVVVREQRRFRLLCGGCHRLIGSMERRSEDIGRMLDIIKEMDAMRDIHPTKHQALLRDAKVRGA